MSKKMKTLGSSIISFFVLFLIAFAFVSIFNFESGSKPQSETINDKLKDVTGTYTLNINGKNDLIVSETEATLLGSVKADEIVIDGGSSKATIVAKGNGTGKICVSENSLLVMKNLTIKDETTASGGLYFDYLSFGGNLRFRDCVFLDSIYLALNTSATFINCEFLSSKPRFYSVWVSDGNASFENCTFTGFRGLKIHEFENDGDVENVVINNCEFKNLSEKPGVVIGQFLVDQSNTTISVKNSTFTRCYLWDTVGSLAGVDGFYETDTYTTEFTFIEENNVVRFVPPIFSITYIAVQKGELTEIYPTLWKENAEYPTTYVYGTEFSIDELWDIVWVGEREDRMFHGWYLDQACTQAFDSSLTNTLRGNVTIYAKVSAGRWTANH